MTEGHQEDMYIAREMKATARYIWGRNGSAGGYWGTGPRGKEGQGEDVGSRKGSEGSGDLLGMVRTGALV